MPDYFISAGAQNDKDRAAQSVPNMIAFLNGADRHKMSYLYYEIAGAITSACDDNKHLFYLSSLSNEHNKNFVQHLIYKTYCQQANSDWCAYMLYTITIWDENYIYYPLELLELLQTLDKSPKIQKHIYRALVIILGRIKKSASNHNLIEKIVQSIEKSKKSSYNAKLLNLLQTEAPYKDFTDEIITNFINLSLLKFLTNTYSEVRVDGYNVLKKCHNLVYLPQFDKISSEKFAQQLVTNNGQQQADKITISPDALLPLLSKLKKLNSVMQNKSIQQINSDEPQDSAYKLAGFIIRESALPIDPKKGEKIQALQQLGGYYNCLVLIREIFMAFAEDDLSQAIDLLARNLVGELDWQLALHMSHLIKKALFKPKLIPVVIKHIDTIQDLAQFLIENYDNNEQKFSLIIDCMYNIASIDTESSELENYVKLLNKMIAIVIKPNLSKDSDNQNSIILQNKLLELGDDRYGSIFHILIKTIYSLIENSEVPIEQLNLSINALLETLSKLVQLADTRDMSVENNGNILYQDLGNYPANHPKFQLIHTVQDRVKQIIPDMSQEASVNKQLLMAKMDNSKQQKQKPNPNMPSCAILVDLYYGYSWSRANIELIKLHLKYTEEDVRRKFDHIVHNTRIVTDNRAEIIDCFIEIKFANIVDKLEFDIERIYEIYTTSNKGAEYLDRLYDKLSTKTKSEHLLPIFRKFLEIASKSMEEAKKFDTTIRDIRKLMLRRPELKAEGLILDQLYKLKLIDATVEILEFLLLKEDQNFEQHQQADKLNLVQYQQVDQLQQQKKSQANYKFKDLKIYFMENFREISTNAISINEEIFDAMYHLTDKDQKNLFSFLQELDKIYPNFISNLDLAGKDRNHSILQRLDSLQIEYNELLQKTLKQSNELYQSNLNNSELHKNIRKIKAYSIFSKNMDIDIIDLTDIIDYLCLLVPMNQKQSMLSMQADCVEIIQKLSPENYEKFKNQLLSYWNGVNKTYLDCDGNEQRFKKYKVYPGLRQSTEFLLECTGRDVFIDILRFKSCCELLLKEPNLNNNIAINHINLLLEQHPEDIVEVKNYDNFINSLQNNDTIINFAKLQYAYPIAFKKIFSKEKGQIKDYLVIRKFIDPDELEQPLEGQPPTQFEILRKNYAPMILALHPHETLDKHEHFRIIYLHESKYLEFFSKYSQYKILYFLLEEIYCCYAANNQKYKLKEIRDWYSDLLPAARKLFAKIEIDLFDAHQVNTLNRGYNRFLACRLLLGILKHMLLTNRFDDSIMEKTIDLIEEIFKKASKEIFQLFIKCLFARQMSDELKPFWILFQESKTAHIKKYMYEALLAVAKHHDCAAEFTDSKFEQQDLAIYTKNLPQSDCLEKNEIRLKQCIEYCKYLHYTRKKLPDDQKKPLKKPIFCHLNDGYDNIQEIIWLLCVLIKQLHSGLWNTEKQNLCDNVWNIIGFDNIEQITPAKLLTCEKLETILPVLQNALENPSICRLAKYNKEKTLIKRVLNKILKFFIDTFYRDNRNVLNALIGHRFMNRLR